jgi:membrane-bound lytic murein transglycosylase F
MNSGFKFTKMSLPFSLSTLFWIMIIAWVVSCESSVTPPKQKLATLEKILKNKQLTVITRNNSHCYYSYRDQEMGFEYDLFKAFADHLGVELKIIIAEKWERMIPDIMNGTGDLIAASMTITPNRRLQVSFSEGYMDIKQHIIVHRHNTSVRELHDLSGQTIHVRKGTSYQEHLFWLKKSKPELIFEVMPIEDVPTEELIRQVSEKEIAVTIADSNIAMLNRRYYPHAIMAGSINETEKLGWAVHPESKNLLMRINSFFEEIKRNGQFSEIYNRYYANVEQFDFVDLRKFHRQIDSRLKVYQPLIMEASEENGFDWRLIASQMYQESHFKPNAKSHAGAYGLMQLTKRTADSFDVSDITDPKQNIFAGVKHLKYLFDYFEIDNDSERLKISLAAYNIGQGHVRDAQKLAVQLRLDPNKWDSMKKTLPLLRYRQYYQNTTYGYCRGTEPVEYVGQIMIYYDILKRQAIEYHKDNLEIPATDGRTDLSASPDLYSSSPYDLDKRPHHR